MYELLLACVLLNTSPKKLPITEEVLTPQIVSSMMLISLDRENVTNEDLNYKFMYMGSYVEHADELRNRHLILKNAPPSSDTEKFPETWECELELTRINNVRAFAIRQRYFYGSYSEGFCSSRSNDPRFSKWDELCKELDYRYGIWDTMREAKRDYYSNPTRRVYLNKLRELMGDDNYNKAILPPRIPVPWLKVISQ